GAQGPARPGAPAARGRRSARTSRLHAESSIRRPRRSTLSRSVAGAARGPEPGLGGLSHVDRRGKARMVDVSAKPDTVREARARATLRVQPAPLRAIQRGEVMKGDVLGVARLAGIMAAKRTAELIPLCHPLRLTGIDVEFTLDRARSA